MKKATILLVIGLILNTGLMAQDYIKYPIKVGSVNYTMTMMGTDNAMTLYFDNSGNTQCTETQMEVFGMKMHNRNIIKGTTSYNLDMAKKTYAITELSEEDLKKSAGFFAEEDMEMEGVTKLGEEMVLDKMCQVYTLNKDGAEVKLWSWKGLMLKMESSAMGMVINIVATSINESAPDPSIFEIPEDFSKI
jgi:hypothetical protein